MARKPDDSIYVARATGVVRIGDTEYHYVSGKTRIRSGHPLLKVFPDKFRPEAPDTERVVSLPSVNARPRAIHAIPPLDQLAAQVPEVQVPDDGSFSVSVDSDPDADLPPEIEED